MANIATKRVWSTLFDRLQYSLLIIYEINLLIIALQRSNIFLEISLVWHKATSLWHIVKLNWPFVSNY